MSRRTETREMVDAIDNALSQRLSPEQKNLLDNVVLKTIIFEQNEPDCAKRGGVQLADIYYTDALMNFPHFDLKKDDISPSLQRLKEKGLIYISNKYYGLWRAK